MNLVGGGRENIKHRGLLARKPSRSLRESFLPVPRRAAAFHRVAALGGYAGGYATAWPTVAPVCETRQLPGFTQRASLPNVGLRATVRNGRLVVDEETQLPDGTVLDLVVDDEGDDLDDAQGQALRAAIAESLRQAEAGEAAPGDAILSRLRARRSG